MADGIVTCKRPMCGNTFAKKGDTHVYCSKRCREIDRIDQQNARRRGSPRLIDPDDPPVGSEYAKLLNRALDAEAERSRWMEVARERMAERDVEIAARKGLIDPDDPGLWERLLDVVSFATDEANGEVTDATIASHVIAALKEHAR